SVVMSSSCSAPTGTLSVYVKASGDAGITVQFHSIIPSVPAAGVVAPLVTLDDANDHPVGSTTCQWICVAPAPKLRVFVIVTVPPATYPVLPGARPWVGRASSTVRRASRLVVVPPLLLMSTW